MAESNFEINSEKKISRKPLWQENLAFELFTFQITPGSFLLWRWCHHLRNLDLIRELLSGTIIRI